MSYRYITSEHSITGMRGKEGKENEDSFLLLQKETEDGDTVTITAVADGMGGYSNGKYASSYITDSIDKWFCENFDAISEMGKRSAAESILKVIRDMNLFLQRKSEEEGVVMGSTLTLLFARGKSYIAANVGDSRIYLIQGDEMIRVTVDQSQAQCMIDAGEKKEEDFAPTDREVHVLTQAMGTQKEVVPDFYFGKTGEEYMFFLCSDGMINRIKDDDLKNILTDTSATSEKVKLINVMRHVIKKGEKDNLTGIIIKRIKTGEEGREEERKEKGSLREKCEKPVPPVRHTITGGDEASTQKI